MENKYIEEACGCWNAALDQVLEYLYEKKTWVEASDNTDGELSLLIEYVESLRK